ncbi:MAG: RnfABCDGE type electron transport complex subunit D [Myxococcales bacterium]|nr:RnfABCDGE type electron transport complex subunit D [Myxococcales bacterium]
MQVRLTTAPFVQAEASTRKIMRDVAIALLPVVAASIWFFGVGALLTLAACSLGALGTEWLLGERRGLGSLADYTAILTGVMLALTLPPALPLWMGVLGGAVSIALGKAIWGGMGRNLFNPALVGRAFLQASFPTAITTFTAPVESFWQLDSALFAPPLMRAEIDAITQASPLGAAKFEGVYANLEPLLLGNTSGSLGETAGLVIVGAGLWLGLRRVFDWRLPISTLLSVGLLSGGLYLLAQGGLIDPAGYYPSPLFMIGSGGLLFAVVFMVTDPVTTPLTPKGAWVFGIGVGLLVVLIRLFGGLPEGVMYAILLMNALVPLIERKLQPRLFGGAR